MESLQEIDCSVPFPSRDISHVSIVPIDAPTVSHQIDPILLGLSLVEGG